MGKDAEAHGFDCEARQLPRAIFDKSLVQMVLQEVPTLREALGAYENCAIQIRDLRRLLDVINEDAHSYCRIHKVDSRRRHVCLQPSCSYTHSTPHVKLCEAVEPLCDLAVNMHFVVHRYIKPWTQPCGLSLAACLLTQHASDEVQGQIEGLQSMFPFMFGSRKFEFTGKQARIFISHNWAEQFEDFVRTAELVGSVEWVWVCAFAIDQNASVGTTLSTKLDDTPFARALRSSERVVVFMDRSARTLSRVWCVLEAHYTIQEQKPFAISLPDNSDTEGWRAVQGCLQELDVRQCEASVEADRIRILDQISGSEDNINHEVRRRCLEACEDAFALEAARCGDAAALRRSVRPVCADAGGLSTLHYSARCQDGLEALKFLLSVRGDPSSLTAHRCTPLHYCVGGDQVELLVQARASLHDQSKDGCTPLHAAASHGRLDALRRMVQLRANIEARHDSLETPLHIAARHGFHEVAEVLLDSGAKTAVFGKTPPNTCDAAYSFRGWTGGSPLHVAAHHGQTAIIELLLARRVNVQMRVPAGVLRGGTALHWAAAGDVRGEALQLLLRARAALHTHIRSYMCGGMTPLHGAAAWGNLGAVRLLLEARANPRAQKSGWLSGGQQPLHVASMQGNPDVVKELLAQRVDPDALDRDSFMHGGSPLVYAALNDHISVIYPLVEARADPNKNQTSWCFKGAQAIHWASYWGNIKSVHKLLYLRADVNASQKSFLFRGLQPLHDAAAGGNPELIRLLVNSRADLKGRLASWVSGTAQPLHVAIYYGHTQSVLALCEARADLGARARLPFAGLFRPTLPIHLAAQRARKGCLLDALLDNQADINAIGPNGTPLHTAARRGCPTTTKALVDRGASLDARHCGFTPLAVALVRCRFAAARELLNLGARPPRLCACCLRRRPPGRKEAAPPGDKAPTQCSPQAELLSEAPASKELPEELKLLDDEVEPDRPPEAQEKLQAVVPQTPPSRLKVAL